ncbi:hypothetical protein [Cyanobium sp. NIES-981]|uniref:hypothetical protein n=1 Tax=Cyanobium sp. NIES-981 TaxID=1851505 RepID=UPI0007DDFA0F|nr:hypothetical protein [Cyanobium sp. NIES-981]SBO43857.1 protein of unknown function [Cyanobium sp. NIES-981]
MLKPDSFEIAAALQELRKRWENVLNARYQTWPGHFSGLMTFMRDNPYLADILKEASQQSAVAFRDWWSEFQATGNSFVGTKSYSIPTDNTTRAVLFYQFLEEIEAGRIDLQRFCVDAYGASKFQDMSDTFNREIVSHVVGEMERKLIDLQSTISSSRLADEDPPEVGKVAYVSSRRIEELRSLTPQGFDLSRLVRLLEELNSNYENSCFMSCAMLVRAITDHIPPIFNKSTFGEVASNYGGRSFKDSMEYLDRGLRKIADNQLHSQIRHKESLPTAQQVHFSQMLDVLLGEIIILLSR